MNPPHALREQGQSVWLDYLRRGLVESGELKRLMDDFAVAGITSNPTIFNKAISGSTDYDQALRGLVESGERDPKALFWRLAVDDIAMTADVFRPLFDSLDGGHGFVSLEASPGLAHDTAGTIAEVKELWRRLGRPNVMIKVPGTPEGVPAIEELTAQGININVTLLFSVKAYEQVALAYINGLERRLEAGQLIKGISSVASFFVSRVDTAVDGLLPEGSPLRGKVAVANAKTAYQLFKRFFSSERWERLAAAGARVQRPLWASTGTKNPAYSDILYVEELIGPDTVNTMPEATLRAFADHGRVAPTLEQGVDEAERVIASLPAAGIDLDAVTAKLLDDGVGAFASDFNKLLETIDKKCGAIVAEERRPLVSLGTLGTAVEARLARLAREDVPRRIWARDHTVWKPDPKEISDRLGWLTVAEQMADAVAELTAFGRRVADEGFKDAVLMGMGGSSLAPEVIHATFGAMPGFPRLHVLDTTDPGSILALERSLDLSRTLFIVASKSGGTVETACQCAYFYDKVPRGDQFVAITDAGSSLEALAVEKGFRRVFLNPTDIGGRYSALSYFGLAPAAIVGAPIGELIEQATEMACACASYVPVADNPGLWLGAVMAEAALAGRDKLTLVLPPAISTFGTWAEQLVAESAGKEGKGILPVEGEPLGPAGVYGDDRLFVSLGEPVDLRPVATLKFDGPTRLGAEFFRWEFATAVAGAILGINPFDQPNVQEAKDATNRILAAAQDGLPEVTNDDLAVLLSHVHPGDYVAITAFIARNAENEEALRRVRVRLRDHFKVATTVGFGPRYLHSTGQFHKGGPNKGVFIQVVSPDAEDVPIPGRPYTFGKLKAAQALGDLESLRAHGRRAGRVPLEALLGWRA
ncbi:MAG: bifunctional transaldolase/phosoglucose isomerase [Dehalococcoidia bacterium]|jgi:transaldolase/glucose-6-phosphate isomerase